MKIYISGMITGLELSEAKKKFNDAEFLLKNSYKDATIINPMSFGEGEPNKTWKDYMMEDINYLFDCDTIYMLNNWGKSKGARVERAIAIELGFKIIYQS